MVIPGEWYTFEDGITRPTINAKVIGADARPWSERFLVDSGADQSSLSGALLLQLKLPTVEPPASHALHGIGGAASYVFVATLLEFSRRDGGIATVRGLYAAFTDPTTTEMSILGRDVLNHFDLIVSRRRGEVLLLAPNCEYQIVVR